MAAGTSRITFGVASNNRAVLASNFLASPCLQGPHSHELLIQERWPSAARAYNDVIARAANDLIVLCHQDVILSSSWIADVKAAIEYLDIYDPRWGVLGCAGASLTESALGYVYSSGVGFIGGPFRYPKAVQTLDEIVLIFRKSSGLRFSDSLRHFHMYGTDICLKAAQTGMTSYAICAFCVHNTHQTLVLPAEFYESCEDIRRMWPGVLPIQTTCIRLTRTGLPVRMRRLREIYLRRVRHKEVGGTRVGDPLRLLRQLEGEQRVAAVSSGGCCGGE